MEARLNVKLLRHTPEPERAIATAARLCYFKSDIGDLMKEMTDDKCDKLLKRLVAMGHMSPFEHASFTFAVEGVSRALTHQLVRHRIATFSQQSQRYVDADGFSYIIPPTVQDRERYEKIMHDLSTAYSDLRKTVPKEDARYVLPNAAETKIMITMNARELQHFFRLRCCNRAQWEIRDMAAEMLRLARKAAPLIFARSGPGCISGPCPEGEMGCGRIGDVRAKFGRV
ncbi:MAG: FAD-dependent thymidylate synthase [archaeon]